MFLEKNKLNNLFEIKEYKANNLFNNPAAKNYKFNLIKIGKAVFLSGFVGGSKDYPIIFDFFKNNNLEILSITANIDVNSSITIPAVIKTISDTNKSIFIGNTEYAIYFEFVCIIMN